MPVMDGFELLAYITSNLPAVPVIVMSAYATSETEKKLRKMGTLRLLEKPMDFDEIAQCIISSLEMTYYKGSLVGISVGSFAQLIEMENKTCLLEIITHDQSKGYLYFDQGVLFDAVCGDLKGEEAAIQIITWDQVEIKFKDIPKKNIFQRIEKGLMTLIMNAMKMKDENLESEISNREIIEEKEEEKEEKDSYADEIHGDSNNITNQESKGEIRMGEIQEVLEKFKDINGFRAIGVFSPSGEMAGEYNVSGLSLADLGALANDVLLKAQKTCELMGIGRGSLVHIQAPKAQIIARCLNEATDYTATASGRAHIHMVLILDAEGNLAMGKMKLEAAIQEIAAVFR
jgi:CheY-like chemotaxis protein